MDLSYLLFNAVGTYVLQNPSKENWDNAWTLMGRAVDTIHFDKAALGATIMSRLLSEKTPLAKELKKKAHPGMLGFLPTFRQLREIKKVV